jgi:hypothetical protein
LLGSPRLSLICGLAARVFRPRDDTM